ncbi:DUF4254 domain-containing protein [Umezawaea sp. Da 62-37]|uniref:DUF4254 domain-containing protein n=1 Tax=Umezawaea sp. Da 62-37 TaxID=3075927 RepID=UPI0028F6EED9|nr:DUF4254 domain-containing protein [Umezawaea sp. Da 62-37]WNV86677.1 DUF4254 domain-containing protein [Umezawaea sp. Da 62-37]WNV86740.1 DUF4254 domain-containing protein [Umezawaea sp. Da 62-37]
MPVTTTTETPRSAAAQHPGVLAPSSADLLAWCDTAATTPVMPASAFLRCLVGELAAGHREQWSAEDRSRCGGPVEVAVAKRRIDELNARRVALVDRLNEHVAAYAPACRAGAALHTETVGSVIDRLVIAVVRAQRVDRARAEIAATQLRELAAAYDGLLAEVAAGQRRLPGWTALKTYGARP